MVVGAGARRDAPRQAAASPRALPSLPPSGSEALRDAAARLAPLPEPRLEAEVLLAAAVGRPRSWLLAHLREPLPEPVARAFDELVARRRAGEPLAYVTGRTSFCGLELAVGPDVLVPRPETELLAEWAVGRARSRGGDLDVVDVGTGSGAIALAIAAGVPGCRVHATDVSPAALSVAAGNAAALGLRVMLVEADLLPDRPARFDLVAANLPYVATDELEDVAPEVLAWEPHGALLAGPDGLDAIRRLLAALPDRLAPGADVALEIGWRQGGAVADLVRRRLPGAVVTVRPDLAGLDRMVTAEGVPAR